MNTITKSAKRSLLSAMAVMLLALVTVAGIVMCEADSSDAADSKYSYLDGDITVAGDSTTNFFVAVQDTDRDSSVTVPAGVTYRGTLAFGYHVFVKSMNMNNDVPFTALKFTSGLTDAVITYGSGEGDITVTARSDDPVAVTVIAGNVTFVGVTGTVTAAGQTVDLKNVTGLEIGVSGGTASINGENVTGTVTVNGTFMTSRLRLGEAELNIPAGSTVTAAAVPDEKYTFTTVYKTKDKVLNTISVCKYGEETALTAGQDYTVQTTVSGNAKFAGLSAGVYTVTFKYGTPVGDGSIAAGSGSAYDVVLCDGKYCIFPASKSDYIKATAAYDSTAGTYTFSLKLNDLGLGATGEVTVYGGDGLALAADTYSVKIDAGVATVTVKAPAAVAKTPVTYWLALAGPTAMADRTCLTLTPGVSGSGDTAEFAKGSVIAVIADATAGISNVYDIADSPAAFSLNGATVNAAGTLDLSATAYKANAADAAYSYLCSTVALISGTVDVTGKVIFQMDKWSESPLTAPVVKAALDSGTLTISAAAYAADVDDDADAATLHTVVCTTFAAALTGAAALTSNAVVSVMGTAYVTEDLTLPTATAGKTGADALRIDIGVGTPASYGKLVVGTAGAAAVVTVPKDAADSVFGLGVANGLISIVNGELRIEGLAEDAEAYTYNTNGYAVSNRISATGIKAAVFMNNGAYGIYADLASALDLAKTSAAAEDLVLRTNAFILKDCELSAEDSLDLKGHIIAVGDLTLAGSVTPTLTVSGPVKDARPQTGNINCGIIIFTGATVLLNVSDTDSGLSGYALAGGTLTVAEDVTLAYTVIDAVCGTLNANGKIATETQLILSLYGLHYIYFIEGLAGATPAEIKEAFGQLKNADGVYTFSLYVNVPGELTLAGSSDPSQPAIASGTIAANGETAAYYSCALTLDVSGTLNLSGYFFNHGKMAVTLGPEGRIVPTGTTVLGNASAAHGNYGALNAGIMLLDLHGTIAYSETDNLSIQNASDAAHGFVMKVTGPVALGSLYTTAGTVTVSGNSLLSAASGQIYDLIVTDTAKFTAKTVTITNLTVRGSATVVPTEPAETAGAIGYQSLIGLLVKTATIGEPAAKLAGSVNSTTVEIVLYAYGGDDQSIGTFNQNYSDCSAIVYGTADNVKISAPEYYYNSSIGAPAAPALVQTAMWLVGDDNYLYATQYAIVVPDAEASAVSQAYPAVEVEGYVLDGWFAARADGTTADQTAKVGAYGDIYARFTAKAYTLTLSYVPGAVYLVNNNQMPSGQSVIHYGDVLVISVIAADGYSADNATVGGGQASVTINVTGDVTVTAAGLNTVGGDRGGLSLADILLIVLVIIIGVTAAAVILRTLRS